MEILSYRDVSDVFDCAKIWVNGYEEYWFMHAWSLLGNQHMTEYCNPKQYFKVFMYALTLAYTYLEFCREAFDESNDVYLPEYTEGLIPEIVIGQMYYEYFPSDDYIEDSDDALRAIISRMKYEVYAALKKQADISEVFVWMYCTGYTPYKYYPDDNASEDNDSDGNTYEINTFDDYKQMVYEVHENILNCTSTEALLGYYYLDSLM